MRIFEEYFSLSMISEAKFLNTRTYLIPEYESVEHIVQSMEGDERVKAVDPNLVLEDSTFDPYYSEQWYLENVGQVVNGNSGPVDIDIDWEASLTAPGTSEPIIVAVVDSGLAFNHPDIINKVWVNSADPLDGIDNDGNGYIDDEIGWDFTYADRWPDDVNGHGTQVASIIVAENENTLGMEGIAPTAYVMPLKAGSISGSLSLDAIVGAWAYAADNGARIVNSSFGCLSCYSAVQEAAAQYLDDAGILHIIASGNDANDNDGVYPAYPASYTNPNILSVSALDRSGDLASFSNFGETSVDLAAPGTDILMAAPAHRTDWSEIILDCDINDGWVWGTISGNQSNYPWVVHQDSGTGLCSFTDSNFLGVPANYSNNTHTYLRSPTFFLGLVDPYIEVTLSID